LREAFHKDEPIDRQMQNFDSKHQERRHKSYIFNLKDMLMKRRQIKIIINNDYLMYLSRKMASPKIKISSEMSLDLGKSLIFQRKYENKSSSLIKSDQFQKKNLLHLINLEKSLEAIPQEIESNLNSQMPSPKADLSKENSVTDAPSMMDFEPNKESENVEKKVVKKKTMMNILSPIKLMARMKRFQNQIQENKKKMETKSDINQLYYTPFFFTRFFGGKLRKWRVKYCRSKGIY